MNIKMRIVNDKDTLGEIIGMILITGDRDDVLQC
jgi:hypothetical protein